MCTEKPQGKLPAFYFGGTCRSLCTYTRGAPSDITNFCSHFVFDVFWGRSTLSEQSLDGGSSHPQSSHRDRSVSDCGSERGSDDLRGMAFLPWSPMDGPSPRSSAWDSPRRGGALSVNGSSAASTPAHRRGNGARGVSLSSPRSGSGEGLGGALPPTPQLTDAPGLAGERT